LKDDIEVTSAPTSPETKIEEVEDVVSRAKRKATEVILISEKDQNDRWAQYHALISIIYHNILYYWLWVD